LALIAPAKLTANIITSKFFMVFTIRSWVIAESKFWLDVQAGTLSGLRRTACGNRFRQLACGTFCNTSAISSPIARFVQRIRFWKSGCFFGLWVIKGQLNQRKAVKLQRRKDFGW
jgi:hypothetical protein